jgi:ubiquinone/menaquinone biosynthesis C-methylase UbiE
MLKRCDIRGGLWIDAGCGNGTFTFPLATFTDRVIAIDKNSNNLNYLNSKISTQKNIFTQQADFNNPNWYSQLVDGILFGFSLHYHPIHQIALEHTFSQLKEGGTIIIIEYASETPVSWVPYPLPKEKLVSILNKLSFTNIQLVDTLPPRRKSSYWNNGSYILKAAKEHSEKKTA